MTLRRADNNKHVQLNPYMLVWLILMCLTKKYDTNKFIKYYKTTKINIQVRKYQNDLRNRHLCMEVIHNLRRYTYSNMTLNASGCTSNIFMTVSVAANPPKNIASKTGEAMAKNIRWPLKIYKIHFLNSYPEKIIN